MKPSIEKDLLPRIGAQFFINPDDTVADTEEHFRLMNEYGIRMVRLFVLWDHVEPAEGCFDFSRYDTVYNLAEKYEISIVTTLTCEDPPGWYMEKPFYHHYANLNDSRLKELAAIYIDRLVTRYRGHKAHYAWILMNEPELMVNYEPSTMKEFSGWLAAKYRTVERLNSAWYQHYDSFDNVAINPSDSAEYWQCFQSFVDWHNFLKHNLITQLNWIKSKIYELDVTSPIHLNPKGFYGNLAPVGQDYWKEGEVSDILGASIHPAWKFLWFDRDDYGYAFSFCVDMIRSASFGKSFWVTELQSGPTLMTGVQPFTPSAQELTAWVWDAVGAGAKSVIYWMWHPRTFGQEAGEWGIVTADHKVSKRLKASHEITKVLENHAALFQQAVPAGAKVAVFYNHASEILSLIEGSPLYRMPEAPIQSLAGVYQALVSEGIAVDFISADQIINDALTRYEMLYLPYSYSMEIDVLEKIADFVHSGGRLWAEAPCGFKDGSGAIHKIKVLDKVFGIETLEYCGCPTDDGCTLPYLCQADLDVTTGDVRSAFSDGTPAVIHNGYGKGTAVYVSSVASLAYFTRKEDCYREQIVSFAKEHQTPAMQAVCTGGRLIQRTMQSGNDYILILENWGEAGRCEVRNVPDPILNVRSLTDGQNVMMENRTLSLEMAKCETVVLHFSG